MVVAIGFLPWKGGLGEGLNRLVCRGVLYALLGNSEGCLVHLIWVGGLGQGEGSWFRWVMSQAGEGAGVLVGLWGQEG